MKCTTVFIVICGLLVVINAQRTRYSNKRIEGVNFSDLLPEGQVGRRNFDNSRQDETQETSPELALFSDLIPARQIDGDINIPTARSTRS